MSPSLPSVATADYSRESGQNLALRWNMLTPLPVLFPAYRAEGARRAVGAPVRPQRAGATAARCQQAVRGVGNGDVAKICWSRMTNIWREGDVMDQ
jgi:hypothetical protein